MFDISHFVTFLAGTAAGAAGTYMADRFTDQRRDRASKAQIEKQFDSVRVRMPDLLREMKEDLESPESITVREFVVLPTERTVFNHGDKRRFEYYESVHPQATTQAEMLQSMGYVTNAAISNWPIYRMTEQFVQHVLHQK